MHRPTLPIQGLPVWARLNGVSFHNITVANTEGKGYGVVSNTELNASQDTADGPVLLSVPHGLILNAAAVEEYAKEDKSFKQLLDAVGRRSSRADVLLFLLVQSVLAAHPNHAGSLGVSNPWTEYIKFLPETVLVPTLWTENERLLLRGTSLEAALDAKISSLDAELGLVQAKSAHIVAWNDLLWHGVVRGKEVEDPSPVEFTDWIRLDALYRSRCLELPRSGESMVPCIDMLNHAAEPSAYYEENAQDEVVLLPRPGVAVAQGSEITISYGAGKSAAEMLFSYGFIDPSSITDSLVLPLAPFPDDPLATAKLVAFGQAPQIHVARGPPPSQGIGRAENDEQQGQQKEEEDGDSDIHWTSPFAYLMCINEEDGLEFRILQQTDGAQQLCVFWQDEDVTERTGEFEALVRQHPLAAVFRLRVVTVVQEALQTQLERLGETTASASSMGVEKSSASTSISTPPRTECVRAAAALRELEMNILEGCIGKLENEKNALLGDDNVVAYLGLAEVTESGQVDDETSNDAGDFS
ncbi:uncharacterized protein C8A04DRAFT_40383 [Dichotomopilus funicola]|uniref:SET domain-containing protein n=1 Tax=Dichotomopilus funicola TaxID=1934379 RepID=A0AAN6UVM3_9PEZI|nr:hypothetical protein C8A04DRAFT_40383 [Dichotomopilus funicola]